VEGIRRNFSAGRELEQPALTSALAWAIAAGKSLRLLVPNDANFSKNALEVVSKRQSSCLTGLKVA
jgi:hypothetical protein